MERTRGRQNPPTPLPLILSKTIESGRPEAVPRALFYYAHTGNQAIEEAQLLRLDNGGLITEITLFGRPLPGLTAVMADIGPRLLRRQNRPAPVVKRWPLVRQ